MTNCNTNNKAHVMKKLDEILHGRSLYVCRYCNHSLTGGEITSLIKKGKYQTMVNNHDTTVFEMKQ